MSLALFSIAEGAMAQAVSANSQPKKAPVKRTVVALRDLSATPEAR